MSSSSFPRLRRLFAPRPSSRLRIAHRRRSRLGLELMEDRQLLSTLTVMNAGDNGNNVQPLAGSLRAAILQADAAPVGTYSTINFNISGSGLHTIALLAGLPAITNPVNLNGASEPGYQANPLIELDGSKAGPAAVGLVLAQSASGTAARPTQVTGLEINAFAGGGASVTASYVQLASDSIGLTQTAGGFLDLVKANRTFGVQFLGGASHDLLSRSVVAGTLPQSATANPSGSGVVITGAGTSYDTIDSDFIGTGAQGFGKADNNGVSLGNAYDGVIIEAGANHNTVSNSAICNNLESGIDLIGLGTSFNTVSGDNIGTSGDSTLPNYNGVTITSGASSNTIGGTTAAARNVISGNKSNGVIFTFGDYNISSGPSNNLVEGNDIGVGPGDTAAVPNFSGVTLENGTTSNTIGGTTAGAANVISGNDYDGIVIGTTGVSKNLVEGNEVGTDATGTIAQPNGHDGIDILGGANLNTVGGTTAGARNVISGNANDGVWIAYAGTSNNLVEGDFIGTNAAGTAPLPNGADGLQISGGATSNTVGGITAGARNVISGNANDGVIIMDQGTSSNLVEGNEIGTGVNGTSALPNGEGVALASGSAGNTVGGTTAAARNLISGNATWGVCISDPGTSKNVVEGDFIGTNAAGTAALPNGADGVQIAGGATGNTVGGITAAARNILSGNSGAGVTITDPGTSSNLVAGDYIGTDVTGTRVLPNLEEGVGILDASANTVGGTIAGARDVISGNDYDGIQISGVWASNNLVEGDYVGTDVTGTAALPNRNDGVEIGGASANTVGGTIAGAHDVISGNAYFGVYLEGLGTTSNVVAGDYIGTDATGSAALGNRFVGVAAIAGASNNLIGGTTTGVRDVISGNSGDGVQIGGDEATGNVVAGDYVGTDVTGTRALPNGGNGIDIVSGSSNTLGGTTAGARDVVSGNALNGIIISGNIYNGMPILNLSGVASNNVVEGDYVGTNAAGTAALPNGGDGVQIIGGAAGNTVGGTTFDDCDVISGNAGNGVTVSDPGTNNNTVQADYIGTDATGELPVPNGNNGVSVQNGAYGTNVVYDLISANAGCGVLVTGSATSVTSVNYDRIGLDAIGTMVVKQPGLAFSNRYGVLFGAGANGDSASSDVISGNRIGVELSTGATGNYINNDKIGTDIYGVGNAGNVADGIYLVGVVGNQMVNDLFCYNGDVGILGINGSSDQDNDISGDFFTVTVSGITYGNAHGATLFD